MFSVTDQLPDELAQAVEAFRKANPLFKHASAGRRRLASLQDNPKMAWGACDGISEKFAGFLVERGINGCYVGSYIANEDNLVNNGCVSYQQHVFCPGEYHAYTLVRDAGHEWIIDWSAAQFGYKQFPLIWRKDLLTA